MSFSAIVLATITNKSPDIAMRMLIFKKGLHRNRPAQFPKSHFSAFQQISAHASVKVYGFNVIKI